MEMEMDLPPPPSPLHAAADRRRCREYLLALEEERRKIQVFQRELPLCFDLVTQTIEGMRRRMDDGVVGGCEEETTVSDRSPGLEEFTFTALKPSLSSSSSEEHESSSHDAAAATTAANNGHGKKEEEAAETPDDGRSPPTTETNKKVTPPDWLQSVQLWRQEEPHRVCKPLALSARKLGGAFQPFEKEKRAATELPASSSATTQAASCAAAVVGDSSSDDKAAAADTEEKRSEDDKETSRDATTDKGKDKDKEGQSRAPPPPPPHGRKPRRCWAPELHRRFLQALQQLGGSHVATPKQIRELMKVDGLTNDEVKSHLQKYRLHTRRPSSTAQISGNASAAPAAPQFVVLGGIWVPPAEYAAAAAAAQPQAAQLAGDASAGSGSMVYAPVAMLPPGLQQHSQQKPGQRQSSRCSDGRQSGDASSASPAVSSSSQTTTST